MKEEEISIESGTGVAQEKVIHINFNDKAINKLFVKRSSIPFEYF